MPEISLKIAKTTVKVRCSHTYIPENSEEFFFDGPTENNIEITKEDIEKEKEFYHRVYGPGFTYIPPDERLEMYVFQRKMGMILVKKNALIVHGAVVSKEGKAYLFIAPSGTGKSTHAVLWKEAFEDAEILNGDIPVLMIKDGQVLACGTPWKGKQRYGTDGIVPLKAICILARGKENRIRPADKLDMFDSLYSFTYKPPQNEGKVIQIIKEIVDKVELYRLECNIDKKAAIVAYEGMNPDS